MHPVYRRAPAAFLYVLVTLPLALLGFVVALAGLLLGGVLSVTPLGPWLIALCVRGVLGLGAAHRALVRGLLAETIEAPVRRRERGAFGWRRAVLGDPVGWRAVGAMFAAPFTTLLAVAAIVVGYAYALQLMVDPTLHNWVAADASWVLRALPVLAGAGWLALAPWLVHFALVPQRLTFRALLGRTVTDDRIRTLEETRAHAVADAAATLRRIERDLHDGTQARLVALGMQLTVIGELVDAGADAGQVRAAVDTARGTATQAVADLRHLVRGIHPPVLDQGLAVALRTLAADCALPVALDVAVPRRPPPAVESIAYFCAAELLANAVKHSGAASVGIVVTASDAELTLTVRDDGRGGAVLGAGSGLRGLRDRARTVDGALTCDSPPGGPTTVTVVLPYG